MAAKCLALALSFLLFTACGASQPPTQEALDFRTSLLEAGSWSFTTTVRADLGERVYDFTLACAAAPDGARLEVLSPEAICGITASMDAEQASVSYEDAALELGPLAGGRLSAMEAPWVLSRCWANGYIAFSGSDGGRERVTYLDGHGDDQLTVDTWFENGVPVYAEIAAADIRCLQLGIAQFHLG